MIELIFMFFILPWRIRAAARPRGRSALRWSMAAIGAWIFVEMLVVFFVALCVGVSHRLLAWPDESTEQTIVVLSYLASVALGIFTADQIKRRLERLPVLPGMPCTLSAPPLPAGTPATATPTPPPRYACRVRASSRWWG